MKKNNKLEQYVQQGAFGRPEIKRHERQQYLGQFRERIIKVMLQEQLSDQRYIDGMIQTLDDPRAHRLYLRSQESGAEVMDFSVLTTEAQKRNIPFSFVDGASYQGNVAMVLVGEDALGEDNIHITISSLPLAFYENQGRTICQACYKKIQENYPEYEKEFKQVGFWHRFLGYTCPIVSEHK